MGKLEFKNPSQDMRVDFESLARTNDFAEVERQKSKNLCDTNVLVNGSRAFGTGIYSNGGKYFTQQSNALIDCKAGETYTVSGDGFTTNSSGFVFFNNGTFVSSSGSTKTATVPEGANQFAYNFYSVDLSVSNLQIEKGSVATDYEPFNGEIVHRKGTMTIPQVGSIQSGVAHVIESYLASDGLAWYRIWSDGWKECGFFTTNPSQVASNGLLDIPNIALPFTNGKSFSNTNYTVFCTTVWQGSQGGHSMWRHTRSMSTTSSVFLTLENFENGAIAKGYSGCNVYCCGY